MSHNNTAKGSEMSYFGNKSASLLETLETAQALGKQANQQIKHMDVVSGQKNLGAEMEKEHHDSVQGISADDPAQVPAPEKEPREIQGGVQESINQSPSEAIGGITTMNESTTKKSASLYRKVASIMNANLAGSLAGYSEPPTGIGVMRKFASYAKTSDPATLQDIYNDFRKLASENPLFNQACEVVALRKFAAQAQALAEATGQSPEDAAAMLHASLESDPEAAAQMQGEVQGEAAGELANAQAQALQDQDAVDAAANQAGLAPEELQEAIAQVEQAAQAQGVSPEEVILTAAQQLAPDMSDDDEEDANAIVEQAAKQGISPEELIEGLAQDVDETGTADTDEEQPAMTEKTASLHHLAGTRRGQNIANYLQALHR